eukprot:Rhum_TRINITY_DN2040_c0_g1::Rhum_TRINITY_DN2040_c0_g1_i1::g.5353::m.5353
MQHVQQIVSKATSSSKDELLKWSDPQASGLVFGLGVFFFYFIVFLEYDLLTLPLRLFQAVAVVSLAASFLKIQVDQKEKSQLTDLVAEHVQSASKTIVALGAEFFYVLNKVIRWDDKVYSAQVLVLSFVVSCLLNHFHLTTLLFLAWIGAFSVPAFLEKNQDAPWMKQAKAAAEENVKKVPQLAAVLGYNQKKTE